MSWMPCPHCRKDVRTPEGPNDDPACPHCRKPILAQAGHDSVRRSAGEAVVSASIDARPSDLPAARAAFVLLLLCGGCIVLAPAAGIVAAIASAVGQSPEDARNNEHSAVFCLSVAIVVVFGPMATILFVAALRLRHNQGGAVTVVAVGICGLLGMVLTMTGVVGLFEWFGRRGILPKATDPIQASLCSVALACGLLFLVGMMKSVQAQAAIGGARPRS